MKIKKIKFYFKLYTEFLSFPFFLGSEDGSYFTILTLSIYNRQKKLGRIPKKTPGGFLKRKAQFTVSGRDLDSLYLFQFSCDDVSSVATRFLAASLISGRNLNCGRDLFGSVVLKKRCHDLNLTLRPRCSSLLLQL